MLLRPTFIKKELINGISCGIRRVKHELTIKVLAVERKCRLVSTY